MALASYLEQQAWLRDDLESVALSYAISQLVPSHLGELRTRKQEFVRKAMAAVKDRLTKEIQYWDHRSNQLRDQELAGRANARINSGKARQRADELGARLQKRLLELDQEGKLAPLPPVVIGGALVAPIGLVAKLSARPLPPDMASAADRQRIERLAMDAVMARESGLGFEPRDVSREKCGYDVESRVPGTGKLRFIEVKGRVGAASVTVTRNEIVTALNKPDDFWLAIVEIDGTALAPMYLQRPFKTEPDFAAESVTYKIRELAARAEASQCT
jgi:hypothetical protein